MFYFEQTTWIIRYFYKQLSLKALNIIVLITKLQTVDIVEVFNIKKLNKKRGCFLINTPLFTLNFDSFSQLQFLKQ